MVLWPVTGASINQAVETTRWGTIAVPLRLVNLNPFHLLYGVPASSGSRVLAPDSSELIASADLASYLYERTSAAESVVMDGETHRLALKWRQGFREHLEYLVEVSAVAHTRGVFDEFIEDWHALIGLPQGRRNKVPHNRLAIRYSDGGATRIDIRQDRFSLSTVRFGLGYALPDWPLRNDGLAIRADLKLPAGNEAGIAGSGGVSVSAWAETSGEIPLYAGSRRWLYATTLGVLAAERPAGLSDIAGRFVFFGRFGVTWRAMRRLTLTVQLDVHSSPYRASEMAPLADPAVMIGFGGAWRLTERTAFEVAVTEDDAGHRSAPDIGLHMAVRWTPQ